MSLMPTYVRGRDGAWYRNPVLVFAEGFLCFDDEDPPELVLWLSDKHERGFPEPLKTLELVLGVPSGIHRIGPAKRSQRVVPGSEPFVFQPAAGFDLALTRRIPVPTMHEGSERRLTRLPPGGFAFLDFPPHPQDPHELEIPKRG